MTESETNLKPASRRDEIMPVGSFWLRGPFTRGHISATTLLPSRTLVNISAIGRREGKIMICRCKHTCTSQGRSPVLDHTLAGPTSLEPPYGAFSGKQVIFFDVRQGDRGPRFQTFDSLLLFYRRAYSQATRRRCSRQQILYAGRCRTCFLIRGYETP